MAEKNGRCFAVVTGASSGIGYELARVFAHEREMARFMPESVKAKMHQKQAEPGSAFKK
jgi:NAD(P)-dependent dehydrogenase (short-subunit alcohol dehydrogenase family)